MAKKAYIVTVGSYSDYRILRVFLKKKPAKRFAEAYNASGQYEEASVEPWDITSETVEPEPFYTKHITTRIAILSGDVLGTEDRLTSHWEIDWYEGRAVTQTHLRPGRWEVLTRGPADKVDQAHADAVAKKRAEIIGL